jgi:uncharacterized protein YqkB
MLCKFRYKTKVVYGFIKGYKRHCQDEILELWIVQAKTGKDHFIDSRNVQIYGKKL